jgi:hypothetical protein
MISFFRYVRHEDIPAMQAKGWVVVADLGMPHACFSVLCEWQGEGEPE